VEFIVINLKFVLVLGGAVVLTACGGGGGSDPAPAPAPKPVDPPKTTYYTPAAPRTGDTLAIVVTSKPVDLPPTLPVHQTILCKLETLLLMVVCTEIATKMVL
jgi:hypothetical protein